MPKEEETAEIFYVGLRDPTELRRSILEIQKQTIQFLKRQEEIKEIRKEKTQLVIELNKINEDITKLMLKLRRSLPKTKLRAEKPTKAPPIEKKVNAKVASSPKVNELDKLEAELASIEEKLARLK